MEPYSGCAFDPLELVHSDKKFAGAQFDLQAMGMVFIGP